MSTQTADRGATGLAPAASDDAARATSLTVTELALARWCGLCGLPPSASGSRCSCRDNWVRR